jgi:hypothetical protein
MLAAGDQSREGRDSDLFTIDRPGSGPRYFINHDQRESPVTGLQRWWLRLTEP